MLKIVPTDFRDTKPERKYLFLTAGHKMFGVRKGSMLVVEADRLDENCPVVFIDDGENRPGILRNAGGHLYAQSEDKSALYLIKYNKAVGTVIGWVTATAYDRYNGKSKYDEPLEVKLLPNYRENIKPYIERIYFQRSD